MIPATSDRTIDSSADMQQTNLSIRKSSRSRHRREKQPHIIIDIATPTLSQSPTAQHQRAILVEASSTIFGNECLRLVNIVFQTSQTFPSIMGTCNNICQYLRKELFRKYPGEYFHIIIGQNNAFGFAIDDDDYFAEMEQEQYRERDIMSLAIPKLSQLYIQRHENAKLINSSTITFGNECMRLVNIAFHSSQIFPSIMGTCHDVSQYLRKQLLRRHSKKHFHIIIGENDGFSFAISDFGHFADIEQGQYRVLIFSTKSHDTIKFDSHDANNQMKLHWKSVLIKRIDNY
ncbi:unnamed protein product [Rotaria sp. Silwood1]|nr:unnamed protein product [Rotaria sp. Silwood1]CAF1338182.1 unnamed protein product [Rotaria sp. Silwood1]CAF3545591.1 unnamed protein product [Rotaria sp. Silwood1]CAF4584511.1 unnamed protein product [Rotaria sp. Silwood1]